MITIKYIKNTGLIIEAYDSSIDVKLENNEATIELNEESWGLAIANGHNSIIDGITAKVELRSDEVIAKQELQAKINEANQYLKDTDWVNNYKLRHDLGLEIIPEDSSKWLVISKRAEYIEFLKSKGGN